MLQNSQSLCLEKDFKNYKKHNNFACTSNGRLYAAILCISSFSEDTTLPSSSLLQATNMWNSMQDIYCTLWKEFLLQIQQRLVSLVLCPSSINDTVQLHGQIGQNLSQWVVKGKSQKFSQFQANACRTKDRRLKKRTWPPFTRRLVIPTHSPQQHIKINVSCHSMEEYILLH